MPVRRFACRHAATYHMMGDFHRSLSRR